jgi:hypothetical protein
MKNDKDIWARLSRLARQAPAEEPALAPFGFATRVVARWRAGGAPSVWQAWGLLSSRALALSCLALAISALSSYGLLRETWSDPAGFTESLEEIAAGAIDSLLAP